jgi:Zn-dependent protease
MGKDIPLGRIAGIKVGMDVTVFLFAAFLAVTLATAQLPVLSRGHSDAAYWVAGIGGAFFLFFSLLVHEIGHALVAQDEGIRVQSMGLTLLGGVTRMETSPTNPGAEFRVSVVGPIASASCGVVFLVGSFLLPDVGLWGLVGALFFWVGYVNLFLAVLNLFPAAPLDGGKVLSSVIWRATNSQSTAMVWSGAAGIVAGMALATWGLRDLSRGGATAGWFTVGVGIFVAYSAFQQVRSAPLYKALEGMTVTDAMASGPPTAAAWSTVGEFLRTSFPRPEHQAYPVVGPDGQVTGLLTAAAIRAVPPQQWDQLPVPALAYPLERLTRVRSDEPLIPAMQKVEGAEVRHALVVATDGRIVGTLDPAALDRAMQSAQAESTHVGA